MKNILIFLFICFGFALNSQITITCYECKKNTTVDCKGCNIQSNLFTGIVIKEKGKPDIPLYEPYKVSNKSSVFTFEDAFGTKTIVNVTSVLSYNTPKKLYDYLSNCLCKPSTIDTDTDRYSVLIQDSILVTYDINGVEIDRDTIRLFDIDTDTKTFLVQDSILVYYDIQNNEIGRDTIKIPFVDTDIQTYLTQDSILVYYDESNTEIDRDTIDIPNITEQGDFRISNDRISNDTLYHNNSIDGIEQFVKLPSIDTTTQSYLPILSGLDTIGYENITYLGGVEVDRDTIDIPNITEQGDFRISNDTLYHNNSIDGIEQFVKLPSIDTTTQSYLPILNGLDTIGYENITYLGGVEVDRDTIDYQLWYEKRICLNTATPSFITTVVTGQTDVGLYFNYDGNPFDITSFKINGNELLTSTINVYDAGSNYIYTNQLVSLFSTWMTTNGYSGTIDDDIDGNGGVLFNSLSGGVLTFEIITDEGGAINTYSGISNLITTPIPADPNNPTIAEVEAWKNANLSLLDQQNGTILTYFVPGDGGSCDVPDYTWTLNKGSELITLDNKREYNGRVHYIADKGNDAQALVGYSHNPYKDFYTTLSNANFLNGDVAHVRKGNFISTTEIPVINKDIKVYLEEGSIIESTGGHFLGVNNLTYVYNSAETSNISVQGSGEIIHRPTSLTRMFFLPYNSDLNVKLKKLTLSAGSNQAWGISLTNRKAIVNIDEVIANNNKIVCGFDSWTTLPNSELPSVRDVFIKTIKVTNQTSRANIIRIQPSTMADNSIDNIHVDNIYFDNTNILSGTLYFQSNMISDINNYVVNATFDNIVNNRLPLPAYTDYNIISAIGSELALGGGGTNAFKYNNLSMNLLVNNVVSNASIVALSYMRYNNSNIKITVKNGVSTTVPFYIGVPTLENNTTINLNMNLEAKTSPVGIFAYTSIDYTSKIKITGTYKTLHPGVATFQIASGSISDALILENCSLINDGTVPNITTNSTTPITIICKNVYMNSLTLDPNINLVGTFYQNINYK
jgi:hypothetical protein